MLDHHRMASRDAFKISGVGMSCRTPQAPRPGVSRLRECLTLVGLRSPGGGSHVTFRDPIPSHHWRQEERRSMKRTFAIILAALAAAALFGGLVYAVLVAAHVSEPAATTVYGLTLRRLWATTAAVLALVGVVIGGLALARSANRFGAASGRRGAIVALM